MYKTTFTIMANGYIIYKCIGKYVFRFSILFGYLFIHVNNKIRTLHFMGTSSSFIKYSIMKQRVEIIHYEGPENTNLIADRTNFFFFLENRIISQTFNYFYYYI